MDNNQIDLTWLWTSLSAAASAFIGWFFGRKKQDVEIKTNELDNVEKAVAIWRGIASDLEGKFTAMQHQFAELQKSNFELQFEVRRLKEANTELQSEIDELRAQIKPTQS
jgi:peptidoglycan hydrolase CwlO-like protein